MSKFCKFLSNGLVYNNNTTAFTVAPCCYYSKTYSLDPSADATQQINKYRTLWLTQDVTTTCQLCLDMESSGLHSYRQASFDIVSTSDKIEMLTVAVNKQCNLACASCSPESSSFWYQENARHNIDQSTKIHQLHQSDRQGHTAEKFIDILAKQDLTELRYIKFGGGEPLMSTVHLEILKLVPNPGNVTVHYTSNFTIMPGTQVLEQWKKFKLIKWLASIDGVCSQFELLRWPADWNLVQRNIKTAIETAPHNVMFGVEHTLNPLNIYYYDQFEAWFEQNFKTNRFGDPSDYNLHTCVGTMDINHTPPGLRELIVKKYTDSHAIVRILENHPWSGTVEHFKNYMNQLDQYRNTNWREIFKEVEFYFD